MDKLVPKVYLEVVVSLVTPTFFWGPIKTFPPILLALSLLNCTLRVVIVKDSCRGCASKRFVLNLISLTNIEVTYITIHSQRGVGESLRQFMVPLVYLFVRIKSKKKTK